MKAGCCFSEWIVKIFSLALVSAVALLVTGCPDTRFVQYESSLRAPTTTVDVFKDKETPQHAFKVIAELSWKGPRSDELRAENHFITKAKKIGGNAVLMEEPANGMYHHPPVHTTDGITWEPPDNGTWLFKAKVAVYE